MPVVVTRREFEHMVHDALNCLPEEFRRALDNVALVSHSYVATGLVLASLLFYRERIVLVLRQGANAKREEESRR
jgi:predicted Zn-dependent protease with MMP-like domain